MEPSKVRRVIVDDRQVKWYPAALQAAGFTVTVRRLHTGDITWSSPLGRVGVEDKPWTALLGDRRNGRLDDELRRLVEAYQIPILMVRGWPDVDDYGNMTIPWSIKDHFKGWDFNGYENLLLGRQLHGVLFTRCSSEDVGARLISLFDYTQVIGPLDGVRREAAIPYLGPLSDRAECIYTILGRVSGLRDRRGTAERLAATVPLGRFLRWEAKDFRAAGFSKPMSQRLADKLAEMNEEGTL